ncbi:bifunctional 2-polyprenyl-6-hydroxyphenol methylase/3-demethylubiquinol 3-O-methyltransferase UbiG [Kutzneria sp. 744]|uniref:class I SAM-dependent methyltransferase n=1 Tax=Kutzneria sp. (strain 744) TaxID=345341 RepID=UPI0007C4D8A3|nr:class I SAM-dependent methyltransferase [Kutzneria sp. 744]
MDGTAKDGSPVGLYALLPETGEATLVHGAIPAGATVLELGAGAGRVTQPLAALGHPVLAVDNSSEMLAHVLTAETIRADIESLRLDRRFDAVLLASQLVNTADAELRRGLLATAAHHVRDGGTVLIQWHPPTWFDRVDSVARELGPVTIAVKDIVLDGDLLAATVHYDGAGQHWEHPFTARRMSTSDMTAELDAVGLRFGNWLTDDQTWFTATPNQRSSAPESPSVSGDSDAQAT